MVSFLSVNLKGSRTIAPRKIALNLKTNPNQNPNANRGQFSSGALVWLPPNPKTSPNLDPNPNPNCPDTSLKIWQNCNSGVILYIFLKSGFQRANQIHWLVSIWWATLAVNRFMLTTIMLKNAIEKALKLFSC